MDTQDDICRYGSRERANQYDQGNSNLVKTTIQATDITAATVSASNQQIIVEVDDRRMLYCHRGLRVI